MVASQKICLIVAVCSLQCSNIGLKEQLENPGSAGASTRYPAFVSSISARGDMAEFGNGLLADCGTLFGIERADCACEKMANLAGLARPSGAVFIAWLSQSAGAVDMSCRIRRLPGTNCNGSGGPTWINTAGASIATGYAGLLSGALQNPLNLTELKVVSIDTNAWTGTTSGGLAEPTTAENCGGSWSNAGAGQTGSVGSIGVTTGAWTETNSVLACMSPNRPIYCFARP